MDVDTMDEQQARQRLAEGGYFVALGVPPGVEFGIDLKSYKTGPQFKGVKMIPPGLHLAHFGTGEGEKQGIFFRSSVASVAVTQWDTSAEDLVDAETCLPEGALRALREAVLRLEMDASLGPHPFEQHTAWINLTNCITDTVLERCGIPVGAKVLAGSSAAEPGEPGGEPGPVDDAVVIVEGSGGRTRRCGEAAVSSGMEIVPHFPHVGRVARYCAVPGRATDTIDNSDPRNVTKQSMDGSESLWRLVASDFGGSWMELLGQLQLSFVLFVSLSSLGGFRHWQALSAMLCRCGDALKTNPALFTAFVRILHAHLKLVPEDFFSVELSKDNFLVPCLSALLQNVLPDECLAPPLLDAGRRLLKFLQQRFGLFSCGADDNNGGAAAASACSPVIPPPSCSYHSNDGDGAGGQMDNRRARTDPGVLSRMSNHPMDDQGVGDRGSGNDTLGAGLAGVEGLTLMQLELSEEDQPVVVPYEEVVRALGDDMLDHNNTATPQQEQQQQQPEAPSSLCDNKHNSSLAVTSPSRTIGGKQRTSSASAAQGQGQGHMKGQEHGDGQREATMEGVGSAAGVLATPSVEHARRWRDIDRLLVSATPPAMTILPRTSSGNSAAVAAANSATALADDENRGKCGRREFPSGVGAVGAGCTTGPVTPVAATSRATVSAEAAAAAAKRYPLLFAATRANEDVLMAAARLVASEEENDDGISNAEVELVQQAVAFLEEEVGGSEDGGAAVWQLSYPEGRGGVGRRS